jgi:hypothetical protein
MDRGTLHGLRVLEIASLASGPSLRALIDTVAIR